MGNGGLAEFWGLAEATPPKPNSETQQEARAKFDEAIASVNATLQSAISSAPPEEHAALDADRNKLYEAYQVASSQYGEDASAGQAAMERVIAAADTLSGKAAKSVEAAAASREKWDAQSERFDEMVLKIGELEEAGHPKSDTLRQLSDAIREKAKTRNYGDCVAAVDQLVPKFAEIIEEHRTSMESAGMASGSYQFPAVDRANAKDRSPAPKRPSPTEESGCSDDDFKPPTEDKQPTLRKGDDSVDGWVEYMQTLLNHQFGRKVVQHNGKFDATTEQWVVEFQKRERLLVDGVVGNQTWAALREAEPEAPSTDGRVPHTHVERGREARWTTEDNAFARYDDEPIDEFSLSAVSLGDEGRIDDEIAKVRVEGANGRCEDFDIRLGTPVKTSASGDSPAYRVRVPRFRAKFGSGTHRLHAYFEPELGGDNWKGEFTVAGGRGGGKETGETGDVVFRVTDAVTEATIPDVTLALNDQHTTTDAQGIGIIEKVTVGRKPFTATHPDYDPTSDEVDVVADDATPKPVVMNPRTGPPGPVTPGTATLNVQVLDHEGNPMNQVDVGVRKGPQPWPNDQKTGPGGMVTFKNLQAGEYIVNAWKGEYIGAAHVPALADGETKTVIIRKKAPDKQLGRMTVTAIWVGDNNEDLPATDVVFNVSGPSSITGHKAEFGVAVFDDLTPGQYTVTGSAKDMLGRPGTGTQSLELKAGQEAPVKIRLKVQGFDPTPGPKATMTVTAIWVGDNNEDLPATDVVFNVSGPSSITGHKAEFGVAVFDDLTPGQYTVTGSAKDMLGRPGTGTQSLELKAGQEAPVKIRLKQSFGAKDEIGRRRLTATGLGASVDIVVGGLPGDPVAREREAVQQAEDAARKKLAIKIEETKQEIRAEHPGKDVVFEDGPVDVETDVKKQTRVLNLNPRVFEHTYDATSVASTTLGYVVKK